MSRSKFSKTQVVFDLSSFQLQTTDKKWFQGNRIMRNLSELKLDMDSLRREILGQRLNYYLGKPNHFVFYLRKDSVILPTEIYKYRIYRDSIARLPHMERGRLSGAAITESKATKQADSSAVRSDTMRAKREIKERFKGLAEKAKQEAKLDTVESPPTKKNLVTTVAFDSTQLAKMDSMYALAPTRDAASGCSKYRPPVEEPGWKF